MRQAQVFISYRRDDAAGYARAIYDALAQRYGADRVFIDVDDIGAGQAFDEVIQRAVGDSKVLLVLIGKRWLGEREGQPPRIAEPGDFVRREVAAALAQGMRVIPLLLDGAAMPTAAELPEVLRPLAGRNAMEIGNTRFAADLERLSAVLREVLGEAVPAAPAAPPPSRRTLPWWLAAAVLGVAAVAVIWASRGGPQDLSATTAGPAASSPGNPAPRSARPAINGAWQADVVYDWPNARYVERFDFGGDGTALHGTASFLRVGRGVLEGSTDADGLRFVTRTTEMAGGAGGITEVTHRYRGRVVGDQIHFVMQTEGGSTPHAPVTFIASRASAAASASMR